MERTRTSRVAHAERSEGKKMKTKISAVLIIMVVICVFAAYAAIPSPVQKYAKATGNEIGKSAEYLSELAEQGELTKRGADAIVSVLQPRLLNMANRVRSKKTDMGIYYEELQLAWQLIVQGAVSPFEGGVLLQALDPCWSEYKKKRSFRPAIIKLHGRLIAAPQGIVMHHKVWLEIEEKHLFLGLEGFLRNSSKSNVFTSWGRQRFTEFDVDGKPSLPLRKETTVYLIPVEIVKELPTWEDDADTLEIFKKAVTHEGARKLCSFQQATILKEENDWRNEFGIDRQPMK